MNDFKDKEKKARQEYEERIKGRKNISKKVESKIEDYLIKAGIGHKINAIERAIKKGITAFSLILTVILLPYGYLSVGWTIPDRLIDTTLIWTLVPLTTWLISWLVFFVIVDLKKYRRGKELDSALPEFLQNASSNLDAGLPIDQALYYAVNHKESILSKEIETVAKESCTGRDLEDALDEMSRKFDSPLLRRTVTLINEGLSAGGNSADLLRKIATDITDNRLMHKDMAASTASYILFISFSAAVFAPLLFALSNILVEVVQRITKNTAVMMGTQYLPLRLNANVVAIGDLKMFSMAYVGITAIVSAMIVAMIRKGSIQESAKYVPAMLISSELVFFISYTILSKLMEGVF